MYLCRGRDRVANKFVLSFVYAQEQENQVRSCQTGDVDSNTRRRLKIEDFSKLGVNVFITV